MTDVWHILALSSWAEGFWSPPPGLILCKQVGAKQSAASQNPLSYSQFLRYMGKRQGHNRVDSCVSNQTLPPFWWLGWLVGTDNSQFFWSHSPSQASVCGGSPISTNVHYYWESPLWSSFSISWSAPHLCKVYIPSIVPTPGAPTPNPWADWLVPLRHLHELWIHGGEPCSLLFHHLLIPIGVKLIIDIHTHNSRP